MNITRVFIHGLESSGRGTKGRFFRERYPDMIIEDFQGTLQQRMIKLSSLLHDKTSVIIVGSSFGGLMGAIFAYNNPRKAKKLILLAPALTVDAFKPYLQHRIDTPVTIFQGKEDDLISVTDVHDIASIMFRNLTFHVLNDDHVLSKTFKTMDWDGLLEARRNHSAPQRSQAKEWHQG